MCINLQPKIQFSRIDFRLLKKTLYRRMFGKYLHNHAHKHTRLHQTHTHCSGLVKIQFQKKYLQVFLVCHYHNRFIVYLHVSVFITMHSVHTNYDFQLFLFILSCIEHIWLAWHCMSMFIYISTIIHNNFWLSILHHILQIRLLLVQICL